MRSAAIVYWLRSLVPMDTKSTAATIARARSAAAGTSIITPAVRRPASWTSAANAAASAAVATIGAITHTSALGAGRRPGDGAPAGPTSTVGSTRDVRSPRTPRAGLSSSASPRNGSGLSAPASSVRSTTLRSPTASNSAR